MSSIPFVLVTGFLGSGKTTFVKQFLNSFSDRYRIAVIQNEFTSVNVDAEELRRTGKPFHLLEMNRGSVFCVCLFSDFCSSLVALVDQYLPEIILLEATGLADPIEIGEILNAQELQSRMYLADICCIVDAVQFLKMKDYMTRVVNQVRVANRVIINKCDLSDQDVPAIEAAVREINPLATITPARYCRLNLQNDFIFHKSPLSLPAATFPHPQGRPAIGSAVIRSLKKITRNSLLGFIEENKNAFIRLKGFVVLSDGVTVAVQSSFGQTTFYDITEYAGATEIIALGPELNAREFSRKFHALL